MYTSHLTHNLLIFKLKRNLFQTVTEVLFLPKLNLTGDCGLKLDSNSALLLVSPAHYTPSVQPNYLLATHFLLINVTLFFIHSFIHSFHIHSKKTFHHNVMITFVTEM